MTSLIATVDPGLWEFFKTQNESPAAATARHAEEPDSNRRALEATSGRENLDKHESLKRRLEIEEEINHPSKRRPVTKIIGIGNLPQDLQVVGRRARNFRLFAPRQDALLYDALGNQFPNPNAATRPNVIFAVSLSTKKEALEIVFFRLNDISPDFVDSLIPAYVDRCSSECQFVATELGKQKSQLQYRSFNNMGTICKRLTEADNFLGLFDLDLGAGGVTFGRKYAASAVDLIRILNGNEDIDVQLRTFVQNVFVLTMEIIWLYRHNENATNASKRQYDLNTKTMAQEFKNIVKRPEIMSMPSYRDIPVTGNFPRAARQKRELADLPDLPGFEGPMAHVKPEESDGGANMDFSAL